MHLPDSFTATIRSVFKKDGEKFLAVLPSLMDEVSQRWGLSDIQPVPNLSFHFVAFARQNSGEVILKMGIPSHELTSEILALKLFNGDGACQLLESDEERGFLLLERLKPGRMLSELEDDDERTRIAADVMSRLWREVPQENNFIKLSDWFDGLKRIRPHFNGGTGPFPKELLERVESFLPDLFTDKNIKLIHGDFHHFNILSSERGWLIIDPKGVVGPVGYEVGPLMINPWNRISDGNSFKVRAERRVSILSERLGWEREKIIKWATAHAILSAWWSIEDDMDGEYSLQCAQLFSGLK
ncbi:MAG: aminoglycoside phosphotransferase family protein [Chloroflexi bacterium]|nr:aminoglycoside phosphotransferase family protein [Chloroflexota bacterium]